MKTVCDSQVQELLNLIKPVVKHDTKQENYNIFKVLEVSRREVILCRFIADLLDPNGSHGLGITPLTIFVSEVLKRGDITVDERYFQVETEYLIDNNRRIDIVIRDVKNNIVFPIEAKIDAKDQDAQLSDYYKYWFKDDSSQKIYYLTPTDRKPSWDSVKNLPNTSDCVVNITFGEHIKKWLKEISKKSDNEYLNSILQQFIGVIEDMSNSESIVNALRIEQRVQKPEELDILITLLNNKDDIMNEIRLQYLSRNLEEVEGYSYFPVQSTDVTIDKHAIMKIMKEKQTSPIAWICVDTNLYLCCKAVKPDQKLFEGKDSYYWQYISPEGLKKKYDMKTFSKVIDRKIKIGALLELIDDSSLIE